MWCLLYLCCTVEYLIRMKMTGYLQCSYLVHFKYIICILLSVFFCLFDHHSYMVKLIKMKILIRYGVLKSLPWHLLLLWWCQIPRNEMYIGLSILNRLMDDSCSDGDERIQRHNYSLGIYLKLQKQAKNQWKHKYLNLSWQQSHWVKPVTGEAKYTWYKLQMYICLGDKFGAYESDLKIIMDKEEIL